MAAQHSFTGFLGHQRLASGSLPMVALAVKHAVEGGADAPILIFDDCTGRQIDVDTRGTEEEIRARYPVASPYPESSEETPSLFPRGRGRPKLGVVAREVTLLPRHWEWLASQPGGPSVALRKLVEEARRAKSEQDKTRERQERAYHFMSAIAGDMHGFEEATRALFANESARFGELMADWPDDIREHAMQLAFTDRERDAKAPKSMIRYLQPTWKAGRDFAGRQMPGNVVMLNLLRFREAADYSAAPQLSPAEPISGMEAFQRYIDHTLPYLRESGGDLMFLGSGGHFLIGPPNERWDMVMLVRQQSAASFLAFASNEAYLEGMAHRTAALEDARLLPLSEGLIP